jgi:hypothetical protein
LILSSTVVEKVAPVNAHDLVADVEDSQSHKRTVIRKTASGDTPEATSAVARFINEPVLFLLLFLRDYYKANTSKTNIRNNVPVRDPEALPAYESMKRFVLISGL